LRCMRAMRIFLQKGARRRGATRRPRFIQLARGALVHLAAASPCHKSLKVHVHMRTYIHGYTDGCTDKRACVRAVQATHTPTLHVHYCLLNNTHTQFDPPAIKIAFNHCISTIIIDTPDIHVQTRETRYPCADRICIFIHVNTCIYVHACARARVCVCACIHKFVCAHICICTCIHTNNYLHIKPKSGVDNQQGTVLATSK